MLRNGALMGGVVHDEGVERAAAMLTAHPAFRVLRRVAIPIGQASIPGSTPIGMGAAVDVETTGLDPERDSVIELAIRRFRYDADGRVVAVDQPYSWMEDPGSSLHPVITRITGLTDADVTGMSIDEAHASELLAGVDIVVAHNAKFDRRFVEDRLPAVAGLRWACTVADLDWAELKFEGRSLGWLLAQTGWFFDAHRATGDVDALIQLLRHRLDGEDTVLAKLLERAARPGWLVRATGASYGVRGALKLRGYTWHSPLCVWLREVGEGEIEAERLWLAREVYDPDHRPKGSGPRIDRIDSRTRHGRLN